MGEIIESACEFAIRIANDPAHGYDQINRWLNPDVDCSSLVILSYEHAGLLVKTAGATYTGNMRAAFKKCGFTIIPYVKSMTLLKGDVVLCDHYTNNKYYGHALIYIGNGKIVQASINEKGTAKGGKPGDQTGREIRVGNFYEYSHGWDCVLRYEEKEEVIKVNVEMTRLTAGSTGAEVSLVQTLLNARGFKGKNGKSLTVDGDFGGNTEYAVKLYQKTINVTQDGIVGVLTWNALLHEHY